jgi:hypothetical protein
MYIKLLIIFLITSYFVAKKTSSTGILKMSFWLCLAYSFLILTHFFSGITYFYGDVSRIFPYFLLCLLLVVIGESLGAKIQSRNAKVIFVKLTTLNIISIFGSLLLVFDMFRMNEINIGIRIVDRSISIIGVIGTLLSSLGIITWLISLFNNRIKGEKIPILSYLSVLGFILGGVLNAGRQSILIISVATVILFIWSSKKNKELKIVNNNYINKKKRSWGIFVLVALFLTYFFFISMVRSQIFNFENKLNMYEGFYSAKISKETMKQVYKVEPLSDIYIEVLFYYSHQLSRLDLFYQNYDYPPTFGLIQLPYIERRFQWLFGKQGEKSWEAEQLAVEHVGRFSSHTWGTFITNFIADFGRLGALLACLIMGVLSGIFYRRSVIKANSLNVIRQVIICTGIVFSIQFSPFIELAWAFPLFMSSFIKIENI